MRDIGRALLVGVATTVAAFVVAETLSRARTQLSARADDLELSLRRHWSTLKQSAYIDAVVARDAPYVIFEAIEATRNEQDSQ